MKKAARTVEACIADLPKTIKIGAYDWTVVIETVDEGNCGQADFATCRLRLWPATLTSPNHAVGIVLHECFHVIFENQGLEQLKRDKDEREEQIVLGFEAGTVSLFRDNRKLMSWMKKWL